MRRQKDKCENAPVESLASERLLSALCVHAKKMRGDKKMKIQNPFQESEEMPKAQELLIVLIIFLPA